VGGVLRTSFVAGNPARASGARWRRVQRLSALIASSSRVSSALRPSTSLRKNASARPRGSRDRQTPKTSQNSRVSRTELGSSRQESGLDRQCPRASNAGSSNGRDEASSDADRSRMVLRRWSMIRCFKIPTSQVRSLDLPAKPSQPRSASRNVSCTSPFRRRVAARGRVTRRSDRGNRRENPPSSPVRFEVGKRWWRRFRPWSARGVDFARKVGRSGSRILTRLPSKSFSGDPTWARHRIPSRFSYAFFNSVQVSQV